MNLAEKVRQAGVVGAGGGGFPTHVKLNAKAETVIANGAECEPLLHKDAVTMEESAAELVRGIQLAMKPSARRKASSASKAKRNTRSKPSPLRAKARTSASNCSVIIIRRVMSMI